VEIAHRNEPLQGELGQACVEKRPARQQLSPTKSAEEMACCRSLRIAFRRRRARLRAQSKLKQIDRMEKIEAPAGAGEDGAFKFRSRKRSGRG